MIIGTEKDGTVYTCEGNYIYSSRKNGARSRLHKDYVPDPYILWEVRCAASDTTQDTDLGKRLKPTQITFKIWECINAE